MESHRLNRRNCNNRCRRRISKKEIVANPSRHHWWNWLLIQASANNPNYIPTLLPVA